MTLSLSIKDLSMRVSQLWFFLFRWPLRHQLPQHVRSASAVLNLDRGSVPTPSKRSAISEKELGSLSDPIRGYLVLSFGVLLPRFRLVCLLFVAFSPCQRAPCWRLLRLALLALLQHKRRARHPLHSPSSGTATAIIITSSAAGTDVWLLGCCCSLFYYCLPLIFFVPCSCASSNMMPPFPPAVSSINYLFRLPHSFSS